jgi:transcriptional regulator with XRE-family HTH domain
MAISMNGKLVRRLRENKSWRQVDLAVEARVSESVIKKIEQGRKVSEAVFVRVATALGVAPDMLRTDYRPPEAEAARVAWGMLPPLPALFLGRGKELQELKRRLGVTGQRKSLEHLQVLTAVYGWPGVGKSTLACFLAYDEDVQARFSDGVLWTSLGTDSDLLTSLIAWGRALGNNDLSNAQTPDEASAQLRGMLLDKRMLLIIDDIWEPAHAIPFRVGGPYCATLMTTREPQVAEALVATPKDVYHLGVLAEEDALDLLKTLAPSVVAKYPGESCELIRELEALPLALQVAGGLLNKEAERGFDVPALLNELQEGKKLLQAQAPAASADLATGTIPSVMMLLQKSTDRLDPETRDRFARLAPFAPKPATFALDAMQFVWRVVDPRPTVNELVDRGLLERLASGRFWMHALLVKHADSLLEDGEE